MKVKCFSKKIILIVILSLLSFILFLTLIKDRIIVINNLSFHVSRLDKFQSNANKGKEDSIKIIVYKGLGNKITKELSVDESKIITLTVDCRKDKDLPKNALKINIYKCTAFVRSISDKTVDYSLIVKDKKEVINFQSFKK